MTERWGDLIVETIARLLVPFQQLYSLYVLAHGHSSPGGGFQGGCIFAASLVLLIVAYGTRELRRRFPERAILVLCALGVFIYAAVGWLCLFLGGNFLDYSQLSKLLPTDPIMARYYGMAAVEVGVQITVMAIMMAIFLELLTGGGGQKGCSGNS